MVPKLQKLKLLEHAVITLIVLLMHVEQMFGYKGMAGKCILIGVYLKDVQLVHEMAK